MDYRGNERSPENMNFFETNRTNGDMPLPTERDVDRLQKVGVEAISGVARGEEPFEVIDLEKKSPELPVDNNLGTSGIVPDSQEQKKSVTFSPSKEFTNGDGEITEREISRLKKDPAGGYEDFQADRIAYLEKFNRTFGEDQVV